MALRARPQIDTPNHKARFPLLIRITHFLAKVQPSGLPDPEYNWSLLDLDLAIIDALNCGGKGIAVLVETLGGRRNYYGYAAPSAQLADQVRLLRHRFPEHKLRMRQTEDSQWALYADYRERFHWD